jgi:YfiR/HmsC-like
MKKVTFIVLLAIMASPSFSQWEEQDIKFLLLKKFVTQIEWPSDFNRKEFKIGVYSSMGLYKKISQLDIRSYHVGERAISYYYLNSIEDLLPCNVIYVPQSSSKDIPSIKNKLAGLPILIISEQEGALEYGSMINFIERRDGNVSYEINESALASNGLKYSYKILEGSTVPN